jgi:hypothetical protein
MKPQLNIIKILETSNDLDFLNDIRKLQLILALNRYFGNDNSNLQDLFSRNACVTAFVQVVDAKLPNQALFDFWEINFDSGTLFFPNSLELAGVKKLQNSFCLDDGFASEELTELADKLNVAKKIRVPEPINVDLNPDNEIVDFKDVRDIPQKAANWAKFLKEHKLSQKLVDLYRSDFNDVCWRLILSQTKLNDSYLESLATDIGWKLVSEYQSLSDAFIQKHQQFLDWKVMSYKQKFTEAQILQYQDKLDWPAISWAQTLSPDLIARFKDKLNWESLCMYQKLDPNTINNNLEKLNKAAWQNVWQKQHLSIELIESFSSKIDWQYASMNLSLTDDQLIQYADKINWNRLINHGRALHYPLILDLIANNSISYDDVEDILNERKKFELTDEQIKELKKTIKSLKKKSK